MNNKTHHRGGYSNLSHCSAKRPQARVLGVHTIDACVGEEEIVVNAKQPPWWW